MTSIDEVPEAQEIHELLQNPDKLKDALYEDEQLLFLLEWLINYTPSCLTPDVPGCIEKLAEMSVELTSRCKLTDEVAKKLAALVERLLRRKLSGYEDCFLNIAKNASLSIAEKIVLAAAAEMGKWGNPHEREVGIDLQLIPKGDIVDQAIQLWLGRVRECITQGNLHKEPLLFAILYRFAQFNNDAYEDAYEAISKMCETDEGLAAFLKYFEKDSHFIGERLMLVEDAEKLALRINNSKLKDEYVWLTELLRKEETIQFIQAQVAKHKSHE